MNFEPCIRYFDDLGLAKVYVRISHNRKIGYIKTKFIANKSQVDGTRVKDMKLLSMIIPLIQEWTMMLNSTSLDNVSDMINFINTGNEISFTEFSDRFIRQESKKGRDKSMKNYTTAVSSLKDFMKKDSILFSEITSTIIKKWIEDLNDTKRAKQMYPNCIKKIFNEGKLQFNDYDTGVIRIKHDPFKSVKIPPADQSHKKGLMPDDIMKIFKFSAKEEESRMIIGRDVAIIIFHLAGINTVDLYHMKHENLKSGVLCYNRRKTSHRHDHAYIEITVPEIIMPLFEKYKGVDRLFNFYVRYSNADNFSSNINDGLRAIGKRIGIGRLTTYTFRHSWATIARNDCNVSVEDIGFCLNHVSAHKITDGYIKKDYSRIDKINNMVIKKVSELHSPDTPTL